jgi:multidrug efflux pump
VSSRGGQLVKLADLGRVELGPESDRSALRYNGERALGIGVVRQSKANLVDVADAIRAELPAIRASLPPGVDIQPAFDQSVFVKRSIQEAEETLIVAAVLVVAIIFIFLRNLRATIIPGLAIPTSIVATFAVMYFLGFSINNFTLLALTLAIGIVVDDAIIVLENAYRHQEELGEDPETAATNGTREIAFAVIATTISLVAVFTPLAFLQGTTGRLFNEFGIAVAGAVIVSGIVALTLTPMLSAKILRLPPSHGRVYQALERGFDGLASLYERALARALRFRWAIVGAAAVIVLLSVGVFRALEREFVPSEDRGFFPTFIVAPEGASLAYTDEYVRRVEAVLGSTEDISSYFAITGFGGRVNGGIIFTRLTDWSDRDRSVQDVLAEVQPRLMQIPGIFAFASNPPAFGFGNPVQFVVRHPDFDSLSVAMDRLTTAARQIPGLQNVDTDLRVNKPELTVNFDRDRAEDLGVSVRDIASTLSSMLGASRVSTFTRDNKLYDVLVQLAPEARATPSDMTGLFVRGRDGELVQLSAVARIDETVGPRQLNHFNRVRSFTLSGALAPGFTLGAAIDSLNRVASEVLPRGSSVELAGESRELYESGNALYFAFALALVVVFMVLASQFESLVHPFTVLLSVPLAVAGALGTLWIAGSTLNLYSQIGMILLIGLVTKNSILLVEYANKLKESGRETVSAVLEAGRIRLRPILMTSVATIMGAMPIALGLGAGSMSRRPLGYAIVGGLLFSTVLTLFLVPAVYVILDALRSRRRAPSPNPIMAEGD